MIGKSSGAVALGLVALCAVPAAHAQARQPNCGGFRFHIMSEGPWPASGRIRAGETCVGGPPWRLGGNAVFKRLYLAGPPEHGKVRLEEGGRFFYTAPGGYQGVDRFTLRVCGTVGSTDGCANIAFRMTVQPARR